jgi:hypothetical protein
MRWCAATYLRASARGGAQIVMPTARSRSDVSFIDVLDRVLDKGVVIDGWARISFVGIDLMTIDGWCLVASIQTYLQYADSLHLTPRLPTSEPIGSFS